MSFKKAAIYSVILTFSLRIISAGRTVLFKAKQKNTALREKPT